jgi:hypothetical protein
LNSYDGTRALDALPTEPASVEEMMEQLHPGPTNRLIVRSLAQGERKESLPLGGIDSTIIASSDTRSVGSRSLLCVRL